MEPFHVIIPARYQSSRLPGKVLREIAGKPMIAHVHEVALAAGAADVWIATDDRRVESAARKFGARTMLTGEHESGSDRIAEVAGMLGLDDSAIIVNLQGDEPLMPPAAVRQVAQNLANSDDCQMATLSTTIGRAEDLHSPHVVKVVVDQQDRALYFSRAPIPWHRDAFAAGSTGLPDADYLRHVGIYAYRNRFLQQLSSAPPGRLEQIERLEQLRAMALGARIHVGRYGGTIPPGIDVEADLERVRAQFKQGGEPIRVLFVCMGNICRSPTAQGMADALIQQRGLYGRIVTDSAGTHASHVGEAPDARACKAAARRGMDLAGQRARRVEAEDFHRFDYILAMDQRNFEALQALRPRDARARLHRMMEFSTLGVTDEVPDPYYGGAHGFEQVLDLLENAVAGLLDRIEGDRNGAG